MLRGPDDLLVRLRADGSANPGFGTGGVVPRAAPGWQKDAAMQPDGRLLLLGGVAFISDGGDQMGMSTLRRLRWNGSPDPSLGTALIAPTDYGPYFPVDLGLALSGWDVWTRVVVASDGTVALVQDADPNSMDQAPYIDRLQL